MQHSMFPRRSVGTNFFLGPFANFFQRIKSLNLKRFGMTYLAGRVGSERLLIGCQRITIQPLPSNLVTFNICKSIDFYNQKNS